jgi:hypothetical protein
MTDPIAAENAAFLMSARARALLARALAFMEI